ncbi:hypothetical protein F4815DRAFT_504100 [Daldinia loculata]|nr:hypothetical protein F4815DRAFT_504100 [Daldinia loculata]
MSTGKESKKPVNSKSDDYERDPLTGRPLADYGESCLRCIDKGLKCTLIFVGFENEAKCAACRRSNSQYCIRQRRPQDCYMFYGHPWNSPNYFAVGEGPNSREMDEILQEHFLGKIIDSLGTWAYIYIYGPKQNSMTLPPFNGSCLPAATRPDDFKSKTWKDVLPISINRSDLGRIGDHIVEMCKSAEEKAAEQKLAAEEALQASMSVTNSTGMVPRRFNHKKRSECYQIRGMHVSEYLDIMGGDIGSSKS